MSKNPKKIRLEEDLDDLNGEKALITLSCKGVYLMENGEPVTPSVETVVEEKQEADVVADHNMEEEEKLEEVISPKSKPEEINEIKIDEPPKKEENIPTEEEEMKEEEIQKPKVEEKKEEDNKETTKDEHVIEDPISKDTKEASENVIPINIEEANPEEESIDEFEMNQILNELPDNEEESINEELEIQNPPKTNTVIPEEEECINEITLENNETKEIISIIDLNTQEKQLNANDEKPQIIIDHIYEEDSRSDEIDEKITVPIVKKPSNRIKRDKLFASDSDSDVEDKTPIKQLKMANHKYLDEDEPMLKIAPKLKEKKRFFDDSGKKIIEIPIKPESNDHKYLELVKDTESIECYKPSKHRSKKTKAPTDEENIPKKNLLLERLKQKTK